MTWLLEIHPSATPPMAFHDAGSTSDLALSWPRLKSVSEIRTRLRTGGGETPTVRVILDNGDGRLSGEVTWQSLSARAVLFRDEEERFAGAVRSIQHGPEMILELEA